MPDPERDLEIPPFPIEELLTSQDREDIKSCAEDLVSSAGEEPVYLTKPQMDERLDTLRGFKGSFLDTDDPLALGAKEDVPKPVLNEVEGKSVFEEVGVDLKGEAEAVAKAAEGLFEEVPVTEEKEEVKEAPGVEVKEGKVEEKTGKDEEVEAEALESKRPEEKREDDGGGVAAGVALPVPLPDVPPVPEAAAAKIEERPDRRVSLVFFGAGLIGVGVLWALIAGLFFVAESRVGEDFPIGIAPILWCAAWAVTYLVVGFGNICFRRWARALAVVTGWVWMAMGVAIVLAIGILFGELTGFLEADGALTAAFGQQAEDLMVTLLGAVTLIAIFVPGLMILYGSAPSVRETCSRWHKQGSWTDRRSTAMLVFGGLLACLAFWFGAGAARETWFLWYGAVVEGLPAQQIYAGACGGGLVLAVLTLDLRRGVWWVLFAGVLAGVAVMAGPWVAVLAGGGEGGLSFEESGFGVVKVAGLVAGLWAAMLVFVLFLRRCLPPKESELVAGAGGGVEKGGSDATVLKGA